MNLLTSLRIYLGTSLELFAVGYHGQLRIMCVKSPKTGLGTLSRDGTRVKLVFICTTLTANLAILSYFLFTTTLIKVCKQSDDIELQVPPVCSCMA